MLDMRVHPDRLLFGAEAGHPASPEGNMAALQGPALLAYDSAVFTVDNFEGLFSFGRGSKQADPTKTGKFGLGYAACARRSPPRAAHPQVQLRLPRDRVPGHSKWRAPAAAGSPAQVPPRPDARVRPRCGRARTCAAPVLRRL